MRIRAPLGRDRTEFLPFGAHSFQGPSSYAPLVGKTNGSEAYDRKRRDNYPGNLNEIGYASDRTRNNQDWLKVMIKSEVLTYVSTSQTRLSPCMLNLISPIIMPVITELNGCVAPTGPVATNKTRRAAGAYMSRIRFPWARMSPCDRSSSCKRFAACPPPSRFPC